MANYCRQPCIVFSFSIDPWIKWVYMICLWLLLFGYQFSFWHLINWHLHFNILTRIWFQFSSFNSKQFLAWLSEAESLCENAEQEIERNPLILKVSPIDLFSSICQFQTHEKFVYHHKSFIWKEHLKVFLRFMKMNFPIFNSK